MNQLPPAGRWALGPEARALAEDLLALALHQGLHTGWLGAEAGFLSNLSVQENLRFMHDWQAGSSRSFGADLQAALDTMQWPVPDWLHQRPSELQDLQLLHARVLRVLLLRPDVLVLHPVTLAQAGALPTDALLDAFASARLLLLAEPSANWPAWPAPALLPDPTEETLA
ncbi:MAG: hypothetical protein PSX71_07995 [bacterium]|nr:hypothetical protein [bacterium]